MTAGCAQLQQWLPFLGSTAETATPIGAEPRPAKERSVGTLVLSGGGPTAGAVIAEAARVAGGSSARVLVVAVAGTKPDAVRDVVQTWSRAGFRDVATLDTFDAKHAAAQFEEATFVWLVGSESPRFVARLRDAGYADRIRERFAAGAVVGGANAGASAVAELMLVGAEKDEGMQQGRVDVVAGLALWPGVIVDERFVAKRRFNRLMSAVLDHPTLVGVGIDEGTGVVVEAGVLRVVGEGSVVVLDARRAKVNASRPGDAASATGVEVQILAGGMTYDLGR
jgi:cyanophycinase